MTHPTDPLVALAVDLLRTDPEGWKQTGFINRWAHVTAGLTLMHNEIHERYWGGMFFRKEERVVEVAGHEVPRRSGLLLYRELLRMQAWRCRWQKVEADLRALGDGGP